MSSQPPSSVDAIMASIRAAMAPAVAGALPTLELTDALSVPPAAPVAAPPAPVPAVADAITLDALARELMGPPLKRWLDANLPELVQREVEAAVARLMATPLK